MRRISFRIHQRLYFLQLNRIIEHPLRAFSPRSLDNLLDILKLPVQYSFIPGNRTRFVLHGLLLTLLKDWNCRSDRPQGKPNDNILTTLWSLRSIANAWSGPDQEQPSLAGIFKGRLEVSDRNKPMSLTEEEVSALGLMRWEERVTRWLSSIEHVSFPN
ncbi:hypothetical protein F4678DRAFT_235345 [Xylaria arbuscula]|nr:hypothetical protein F4678DRAFT_235345 [Xylaria arbuscula]